MRLKSVCWLDKAVKELSLIDIMTIVSIISHGCLQHSKLTGDKDVKEHWR